MKVHLGILCVLMCSSATLYSGDPRSFRMDSIKGVWLDEQTKIVEQTFPALMPGLITDYGSSQARMSMMGFLMSDHMKNDSQQDTTSHMMVRLDQASLLTSNDGSVIDYRHENMAITIDQKIFVGERELISRTIKTSGSFSVSAGGVLTEPTGNLHFSLPACHGRPAATYDVALSGHVVPFSIPL